MRRTRAAACLVLVSALPVTSSVEGAPSTPDGHPVVGAPAPRRVRLSTALPDANGARGVVEVLRDDGGVIAFRIGLCAAGPAGFVAWTAPTGDAVALEDSWWTLAPRFRPDVAPLPEPAHLQALGVDVVDATVGDPDGDGTDEVVVVFRRPFRETVVSGLLPGAAGTDEAGRSLHLGLYGPNLEQEWVAGTVFRPVSAVAACDGALALAYASDVGAVDRVAAGASLWGGFGFTSLPGLPDLPGPGEPACADVDGDGRTEPIIINRIPERRNAR